MSGTRPRTCPQSPACTFPLRQALKRPKKHARRRQLQAHTTSHMKHHTSQDMSLMSHHTPHA
eukprot:7717710-Alexandrium_andersonii.AAC.1